MIEAILKNSESVAELCRRHGVSRLGLFGSATREMDFDPATSDLDFAVEFQASPPGGRFDAYMGLAEDLEALFRRPVDLVELQATKNPYFLRSVAAELQPLYVAA
jgi:predicted nucleotidyltransferase